MTVRALVQGWHQTRMAPSERRRQQQVLREVSSGLRPTSELDQVHAKVRSSIRLHARVHWLDLRTRSRAKGIRAVISALPPLFMAPVSSLGRRLGGTPNEAVQDPSLAATWRRVIELAGAAHDGAVRGAAAGPGVPPRGS